MCCADLDVPSHSLVTVDDEDSLTFCTRGEGTTLDLEYVIALASKDVPKPREIWPIVTEIRPLDAAPAKRNSVSASPMASTTDSRSASVSAYCCPTTTPASTTNW